MTPALPATLVFDMPVASFLVAVAAYLLGSIPTGYLLVRFFRKQDIRTLGSGNIGATNVIRSGARGLGAATFLLDVLKGCAAVWLGALLAPHLLPGLPVRNVEALAALCAVLGHMFPVWLELQRRQGCCNRLWRLSGCGPACSAGIDHRLCSCFRNQPLCLAGVHSRRSEFSPLRVVSCPG